LVAERHADGLVADVEFAAAAAGATAVVTERSNDPEILAEAANAAGDGIGKTAAWKHWSYRVGMQLAAQDVLEPHPYQAAMQVSRAVLNTMTHHRGPSIPTQADFLRDIFGNPFRPVIFSPEWRTSTVLALARQIYDSRDFSAMPILADALQDAGCDNAEVLNHCLEPVSHVRGCWVIDLILSKDR
jgi:hypothetical protein